MTTTTTKLTLHNNVCIARNRLSRSGVIDAWARVAGLDDDPLPGAIARELPRMWDSRPTAADIMSAVGRALDPATGSSSPWSLRIRVGCLTIEIAWLLDGYDDEEAVLRFSAYSWDPSHYTLAEVLVDASSERMVAAATEGLSYDGPVHHCGWAEPDAECAQ